MVVHGFSWLLYKLIHTQFSTYLEQFNNTPWQFAKDLFDDWLDSTQIIQIITSISNGYNAIIGTLPPVFVMLFGLGFTLVLVGTVISIILRLL